MEAAPTRESAALRAWGLVLVVASGLVCTGECPASILLLGEVPGVWR